MEGYFVPITDIIDTHDNILIEIELPGLIKNDDAINIELTNGLLEIKGEIKGDIKALDEKINGLTARVAYQEFTNRGILIALVVAILGGAAKLFGFFPNP